MELNGALLREFTRSMHQARGATSTHYDTNAFDGPGGAVLWSSPSLRCAADRSMLARSHSFGAAVASSAP